jgi:tetratricopeptide (TPR) repeat protein
LTLHRDEATNAPLATSLEETDPRNSQDMGIARAFMSDEWMRRTAQSVTTHELGHLAGYQLTRVVQRGVQGTVYEAIEPRTGRRVAIKRLPLFDVRAIEADRFERETEALASLGHPNVVTLLAAPVEDGARLIVMEWIDGLPLDRWADELWTRVTPREAISATVACITKVAHAVAAAHARGIMHRDLKPTNVLVLPSGEPKVLDFGLAKGLHTTTETATRTGGFAGTPAWASPEQIAGNPRDLDARTDVHALGLLLYRALAGRTAFDTSLAILPLFEEIRTRTPSAPSRCRKGVPRELDLITMHALEKDPTRRYQSAEGFARDLSRFIAGEPIDAHPPNAWYVARKFVGRHRAATALAALTVAAVLTGTFVSAALAIEARDARNVAVLRADEADQARTRAERMNGFFQDLLANLREREVAGDRAGAREILTLAAESIERAGTPRESEADLRTTLGVAFYELGEYTRSVQQYERAAALLDEPRHARQRADVLLAQARALMRTPDHGRAPDAARTAKEILHELHASVAELADAQAVLAASLVFAGAHASGLTESERAMEFAREAGDQRTLANAMSTRALALEYGGRLPEATEQAIDAALLAKSIDELRPLERARMLHNAAFMLTNSRRAKEALPFAEESLALREAHFGQGHPATTAGRSQLALVLRDVDRCDDAVALHLGSIAALTDDNRETMALRANVRRHLARVYQVRANEGDADLAIVSMATALEEFAISGQFESVQSLSTGLQYFRAIRARDGLDVALEFVRAESARLAALAQDRIAACTARCEFAREFAAELRKAREPELASLRNALPGLIAMYREDLEETFARRGTDSETTRRVELALAELLTASANAEDRIEANNRATRLRAVFVAQSGEQSSLVARCNTVLRLVGTADATSAAPPAQPAKPSPSSNGS